MWPSAIAFQQADETIRHAYACRPLSHSVPHREGYQNPLFLSRASKRTAHDIYAMLFVLHGMTDYASHKRARFDYQILETFEAGISLLGFEVKAVRVGRARLEGSFIVIRGGEAFLVGCTIAPYQPENTPKDYDPERPRKLLLAKKELAVLLQESEKKGLTIVPLSMYNAKRNIKVKIAIVKGKKEYDKREKIKERDTGREINRAIKRRIG